MENAKKNLKILATLILALSGLSLIRMIVDVIRGGFKIENTQGYSEGILMAAMIVTCVLGFILLLPQIYVGIKGIKVSNTPDSSKAHIVWAIILLVCAVIGTISAVSSLARAEGDAISNVFELANRVLDVAMYFLFVKYAKQVQLAA